LLLSSLALALALQLKTSKPSPIFDKFAVPAAISEFEYRATSANIPMIRDAAPMYEGVGIPFIKQLSSDHQTVVIRVLVSEKELPKDYEERKKVLLIKAANSVADVAAAFDLNLGDKAAIHAVRAEFVSIHDLVDNPTHPKIYAEWKDEERTFH
jgi:hypothetical protein